MVLFGIKNEEIKACAGTGLIVDIKGTGEEKNDGPVNSVALRADIDGLPMPENNKDLEYRTKTNCAHMCGHDGHMVTILGVA